MMRGFCSVLGLTTAMLLIGAPAVAEEAKDDQALTDLVQILHNEGVLDEGQYTQLTARAAKQEAKESWTDRITVWGDFRARYEGFYFVDDDDDVDDRSRLRYRIRLNGKAKINDRAMILFRLNSGSSDHRSANRTLGDAPDFAHDPIRIDRAYVRISPFAEGLLPGESGTVWIEFGKVPNPYRWKIGKDYIWDADINPEGVSFLFENDLNDNVNVFANAGYYVVEEIGDNADPNLLGAQVGGHFQLTDSVTLGSRLSWYRLGDINDDELDRGARQGNIFDGLTGSESLNLVESGVYLKAKFFENWPITIYGNIAANLDARSSRTYDHVGKENLAWGVGAEVGDSKKVVKLGVGWWHYEANAFYGQFIDSDIHDGKTNRKGLAFYGSKQILPNTEVVFTTLWSETVDDSLPIDENRGWDSVSKADRVRFQADMKFNF